MIRSFEADPKIDNLVKMTNELMEKLKNSV